MAMMAYVKRAPSGGPFIIGSAVLSGCIWLFSNPAPTASSINLFMTNGLSPNMEIKCHHSLAVKTCSHFILYSLEVPVSVAQIAAF